MDRYGTIVVVGGGCYGSYYVRQLRRAMAAGALWCQRVLVVDRDAACRVGRELAGASDDPVLAASAGPLAPVELEVREWDAFFADYLGAGAPGDDAIVPSPLMPHLMYRWIERRAAARWPDRRIETRPIGTQPDIPWQRAAADGTQYVSFAEWTCPVNCIEPATCPAIRAPRAWSLPPAIRAYVSAEQERGRNLAGPVIFHCRHRAYGVGMFDTREVLDGDRVVAEAGDRGPVEVLVGTVSHCHGALNVLTVGE